MSSKKNTIIVQNQGMQHWLNMSLAQTRGISMNMSYALPAQYLWKLIRTMAGEEDTPDQSPFSREVLCWRIYHVLSQEIILSDPDFSAVNRYWQQQSSESRATSQQAIKRFTLAQQLADLYEQYLVFRPEWIDNWSKQVFDLSFQSESASDDALFSARWQGKLWYLLTKETPYNPKELVNIAIANMPNKLELLPKRLSFFGINAMAPIWLKLIEALSEHIEVHFFHLNPCFRYWGDLVTEKQAIAQLNQWTEGVSDLAIEVGNPLLANFGQQGREFLSLLQEVSTVSIEVFEQHEDENDTTLLAKVQQDILSLSSAKYSGDTASELDNSICITNSHSALREIQGLHDWLLHQFNQDKSLTPKDVLVMCPQIEDYAPYINAVFSRGWQDIADDVPPLPCSIADRVSKDAEPVVAAFIQLLQLPDSRFNVTELLALMRVESIASKSQFNQEEIDKVSAWLSKANVHWGLDENHKSQVLNSQASCQFTWQQGFERLLRGFAYADQQSLVNDQVFIEDVEGQDAILLGRLMLFIERLQRASAELTRPRSITAWQTYLFELIESLFDGQDQALEIVYQAIEQLVEYTHLAEFKETVPLNVISEFLNSHFSQADPGRQFMVGQVTFCSMVPMRSIPFKVIAVLGLNEGEFPRQRQPLGFDLIGMTSARLGDRSRRGDDRYLFLEAIISARQALYLSYQGRDIKNNKEKQPSLVLKTFLEYLLQGYGIDYSGEQSALRQLAMQPFSIKNYLGRYASFDPAWYALAQPLAKREENILTVDQSDSPIATNINLSSLIACLQHPAKYFAQHVLGLNLQNYEQQLSDQEPFDFDHLQSYLFKQEVIEQYLNGTAEQGLAQTMLYAQTAGHFPDAPTTLQVLSQWHQDAFVFSQYVQQHAEELENITITVELTLADNQQYTLETSLPTSGDKLMFYRSSTAKGKDKLQLYMHRLLIQLVNQGQASILDADDYQLDKIKQLSAVEGVYFDTKSQKVDHFSVAPSDEPLAAFTKFINCYQQAHQQALLLNVDIADKYFTARTFGTAQFEKMWLDSNNAFALSNDPYLSYFWSTCPEWLDIEPDIKAVYEPMYRALVKAKPIKVADIAINQDEKVEVTWKT